MVGEGEGELLNSRPNIIPVRGGARHRVSIHIPARCQSRQQDVVDPLHAFAQVGFENPVQLQALPGSDFQRGVADRVADIEMGD